jgi:hypothetical protein
MLAGMRVCRWYDPLWGCSVCLCLERVPATPAASPKASTKKDGGASSGSGLLAPSRQELDARLRPSESDPVTSTRGPGRLPAPSRRCLLGPGTQGSGPGYRGGGQWPCGFRGEGARRGSSPPLTPLQPPRWRWSLARLSSSSGAGKVTLACSLHFLTLVDIAPPGLLAPGCQPASAVFARSPGGAPSPPAACASAAPGDLGGKAGERRAARIRQAGAGAEAEQPPTIKPWEPRPAGAARRKPGPAGLS